MTDKNSRTMKTGDVVEITGAYFKNDNGLYFVEHTPGDPNWSGRDHCLRRIKRNGELSTAKDNICFWPIHAFVNSRDKRAAANQWNQEHAEIEIKTVPNTVHIAAFFTAEADSLDVTIKRYTWDFGEDCQTVKDTKETQAFYRSVADGLRAEQPTAATVQPSAATQQPEQQDPATGAGAEAPAEQPEATTAEQAEQPTSENRSETVPPYGSIDEETARNAHYCIHMSDYKPGSATASYRNSVNKAAQMVEQQKARVSAFYHDKLDTLLDRYARRLAQWTNDYNRNGASCPSILISGGSNFPVRKKERQNAREASLWREYKEIEAILDKIKNTGTGPVDLADPYAREMLTDQLQRLQKRMEDGKAMNAHYRKHKTMKGFPGMSDDIAARNDVAIANAPAFAQRPMPDFELSSLRGKIKRVQARLEELDNLQARQAAGETAEEHDGFQIVRNAEQNRLQIIFNGKPDEATRSALKSNGFRWSPRNNAWQRQLTGNAERAARRALSLEAPNE